MMRYKGFIKVAILMASMSILSPVYPGHTIDWKTCIRTSVGAANQLVALKILSPVACPPDVGGICWRPGPRWPQFTFGNQNRTGPCLEATYPASKCAGLQGDIEICGVSAVFLQGPSFEYIHSSQPPTVLYMQATAATPNISGRWQANNGLVYEIDQNRHDFTWNVVLGKIETATGTILGNEVKAKWQNNAGTGSATGRVTQTDAQNRATRIEWSNRAVFFR